MHLDVTDILAIYGATVSSFAVGWNVYRDSHDRARLKLSAILGHQVNNDGRICVLSHAFAIEEWPDRFKNSSPCLFLTITNTGRRPVVVEN